VSKETPVVDTDREILGGTSVFVGTRVPVKSLYDYLEAGDSLDDFLECPGHNNCKIEPGGDPLCGEAVGWNIWLREPDASARVF